MTTAPSQIPNEWNGKPRDPQGTAFVAGNGSGAQLGQLGRKWPMRYVGRIKLPRTTDHRRRAIFRNPTRSDGSM